MFAWFLRLAFASLAGALLWAWAPHAIDNYRATHGGVRGTFLVETCRDDCTGIFYSHDGTVRVDGVELATFGSATAAIPGRGAPAWIAGAGSTSAHTGEDWLAGTIVVGHLFLLLAMVLMILTPHTPAGVTAGQRVVDLAGTYNLGTATGSTRWTAYRYLIPALILLELGIGIPLVYLAGQSGQRPEGLNLLGPIATWAILSGAGAVFTVKTWRGVGRSLHLFEQGLVVSRGHDATAYAYRDVVKAKVDRYAPRDGDDPVPYAVTLHDRDGKTVRITLAQAVGVIVPHVPVG